MCATSSEGACSRAQRGFTLPELVAVLVLVGLLAAVALPKMQGALSMRDDAWHDEVVSALRHAHQTAVSHRRLVCVTVGAGSVTLSIAAANPATSCGTALAGPGGAAAYASTDSGSASLSPAGTIYFQPSGRATSDGAGSTASDRSIAIAGSDTIVVIGETGHVE
jgi:MSHA pilin protein MshC